MGINIQGQLTFWTKCELLRVLEMSEKQFLFKLQKQIIIIIIIIIIMIIIIIIILNLYNTLFNNML